MRGGLQLDHPQKPIDPARPPVPSALTCHCWGTSLSVGMHACMHGSMHVSTSFIPLGKWEGWRWWWWWWFGFPGHKLFLLLFFSCEKKGAGWAWFAFLAFSTGGDTLDWVSCNRCHARALCQTATLSLHLPENSFGSRTSGRLSALRIAYVLRQTGYAVCV